MTKFVSAPPVLEREAFLQWLRGPSRAWNATLDWTSLPWYAEQKVREVGGLATLVGFWLDEGTPAEASDFESPTMPWKALAVGDACLLHVRHDAVLARFPVEDIEAFGNTPPLLCTHLQHDETMLDAGVLHHVSGTCQPGDLFFLATDAMAEWLYSLADLEGLNEGLGDWSNVATLIESDFKTLIQTLRTQSFMRNDDVTLLVVRVHEARDG